MAVGDQGRFPFRFSAQRVSVSGSGSCADATGTLALESDGGRAEVVVGLSKLADAGSSWLEVSFPDGGSLTRFTFE